MGELHEDAQLLRRHPRRRRLRQFIAAGQAAQYVLQKASCLSGPTCNKKES